jgi:hypothetical protein
MSKKLILGFALAVVLFSGPLLSVSAQADCGCLPHFSLPSCWFGSCGQVAERRDLDRSEATCQGAYNYGPTVPSAFGAVGAY